MVADGEEEAVDVDIKDSAILADEAGAGDAECIAFEARNTSRRTIM